MNIANDNNSKDLGNCKHSSKDIRSEYNARTETDNGSFKITAITDIDNDNNDIDDKDNHSVDLLKPLWLSLLKTSSTTT